MADFQHVVRMLRSESEEDRLQGLKGLAEFKTEAFLDHVYHALGDPSWRIRKEAADLFLSLPRVGEFVGDVIALLYSQDNAGLRNAAVEILVRLGPKALPLLLEELGSDDRDVRKFVLDILGEIRDHSCVPALIAALGDPDDNVRTAAAENLGKIRATDAIPSLLEALERPDLWFRFTILEALGSIGRGVPVARLLPFKDEKLLRKALFTCLGRIGDLEAIPTLIQGLTDSMRNVREASAVALGKLGERHPDEVADRLAEAVEESLVASLIDLFGSHDLAARKASVKLAGWLGDDRFVPPLLPLLEQEEIQEEVLGALLNLGRSKLGSLLKLWPEADDHRRLYLAYLFGEIGAEAGADALLEGVNSSDPQLKLVCVQSLGRLENPGALGPLIQCLSENAGEIREAATQALCRLGRRYREKLVQGLGPLLESNNAELRRCAVQIFIRLGGEEADEALNRALKDESPLVRRVAVGGLAGENRAEHLPAVMLALTDEDSEVRRSAAEALGMIRDAQAVPALELALQDEDIWVRAAAIRALGQIGGSPAVALVQKGLKDPVGLVAIAALETLALLDAEKAFSVSLEALEHEDADVIIAALQRLSDSERSDWISPVLDRLLNHPHWEVRSAFARILARLEGENSRRHLESRLLIEEENLVRQQLEDLLYQIKEPQG